jgi:NADH:ubiquinone oxidoreductase subunit E
MFSRSFSRSFGGPAITIGSFCFRNIDAVKSALARHDCKSAAVVPLLQLAQEENGGYLNTGCIDAVAHLTQTRPSEIEAKAQFLLHPKFEFAKTAKHTIECCAGAACRVGGSCIQSVIERATKGTFAQGQTPDGEFALVQGSCNGGCSNGPWMKVDGYLFVRLTEKDVETIVEKAARGDYGKMFVYERDSALNKHGNNF